MGRLFLVATPIGNLEDITLRALRVLREVDLIASEDTRHSGKLLRHYGIATPMISYHEHSGPERERELLDRLQGGDVALITDAGMPGISDPGFHLVRAAIKAGIPVVPIPGPSAITTAVPASGLVPGAFLYLGFLPRRAKERRALLESVRDLNVPLVLYEAPHRLEAALADLETVLGDRPLALARELTKLHEEIERTTVAAARERLVERPARGEYVLIVGPGCAGEQPPANDEDVSELLRRRIEAGDSPSAAARAISAETGRARREVYQLALQLQSERRHEASGGPG